MSPSAPDLDDVDVVVIGTGLRESIAAAILAWAGKSVVQVDPSATYGGEWASLNLAQLAAWSRDPTAPPALRACDAASDPAALDAKTSHQWLRFTCVDVARGLDARWAPGATLGDARRYAIDLTPRAVPCVGDVNDALLASGAHHSVQYKLFEAHGMLRRDDSGGGGAGWRLAPIPASKGDLFRDREWSLADKRLLMSLLKRCATELGLTTNQGPMHNPNDIPTQFQRPGLDSNAGVFGPGPFAASLAKAGLGQRAADVVRYGMCFEGFPFSKDLSGEEARVRMRSYLGSLGRFGNGDVPFLASMYGVGELPQAFCRAAAVRGAVQMLRTGVAGVRVAGEGVERRVAGVRLSDGRVVAVRAVVCGMGGRLLGGEGEVGMGGGADDGASAGGNASDGATSSGSGALRVLRAALVTDGSLQRGSHLLTAIAAPNEFGLPCPVAVMQVGASVACAPVGRHVVHLTAVPPPSSPALSPRAAFANLVSALFDASLLRNDGYVPDDGDMRGEPRDVVDNDGSSNVGMSGGGSGMSGGRGMGGESGSGSGNVGGSGVAGERGGEGSCVKGATSSAQRVTNTTAPRLLAEFYFEVAGGSGGGGVGGGDSVRGSSGGVGSSSVGGFIELCHASAGLSLDGVVGPVADALRGAGLVGDGALFAEMGDSVDNDKSGVDSSDEDDVAWLEEAVGGIGGGGGVGERGEGVGGETGAGG